MTTWGQHDNQTYLDGIRQQDDAILEEIYANIQPPIITYLLKKNVSQEEAEDIFQDGLITVYNQILSNQLNLSSTFSAYLLGVCKRLHLKLYHKNKLKERVTNEASEVYEDDVMLPDEILEEMVIKNRIQKLFLQLDKSCQQVMDLFWQGKEHKEIQKIMGFGSEGYTRKKKHKCQKKLEAIIKNDPILKDIYKP